MSKFWDLMYRMKLILYCILEICGEDLVFSTCTGHNCMKWWVCLLANYGKHFAVYVYDCNLNA